MISVSWPQPPLPSGLARVDSRILWAAQTVQSSGPTAGDSVTVITAFDADGSARRLSIRGWYQLFASDTVGSLLFGNSWTHGMNWVYGATWGPFPAVFLVNGRALLRAIDDWGVPVNQ